MNTGGPVPPPGAFNMEPGVFNFPGMPLNNMISKVNTTDAILYVGNLHPSMDETRLFEIFRSYGAIKNCKLMKDLYTQESRGFAFVTFEN
jgi:RNA recognition motif-containing protein